MLILQSALRNVAVGADTYAYNLHFERLTSSSWDDLFAAFPLTYIDGQGKDPGYGIFVKIAQLISNEYQIFLFIVAVFFFVGLDKMLKNMRLNLGGVCVAMLVYEVLYYDFFSITGIRQTIATGFFFYAFPYISKKKFIPYVLIIIIGASIHKSSLILLPFYFLANLKYSRKYLTLSLIALPFIFGIAGSLAIYVTSFNLFESYSYLAYSTYDTQGAINFLIYLIVTAVLTIWTLSRKKENSISPNLNICINALSIAILLAPLAWVDPSFMRICQYFSIFSMFLLGPILQKFCSKHNLNFNYTLFCVFVLFALVIIKRNQDYAFFWQHMELPDNYLNIDL